MSSSDVTAVKHMLHEVATHAYSLASGLQNIAPAQVQTQPAKSVQYLLDTASLIAAVNHQVDEAFSKG